MCKMDINFFALLYVPNKVDAVNAKTSSVAHSIRMYLRNAMLLGASIKRLGVKLVVITNNAELLRSIEPNLDEVIDIVLGNFVINVPIDVKFSSAHHKIDVFKYMSMCDNKYLAFLDLDMVAMCDNFDKIHSVIDGSDFIYYNISDQVAPAYGVDVIENDKNRVGGVNYGSLWAGGEFLLGSPKFFEMLYLECMRLWPKYIENVADLHHHGDEMLVSVAIDNFLQGRLKGINISAKGIVQRFWSGNVLHPQEGPLHALHGVSFLHLPQDKIFLATWWLCTKKFGFNRNIFLFSYYLYWFFKKIALCMRKLLIAIKN